MDKGGFVARKIRQRLGKLLGAGPDDELLDTLEEAVLQAESRIHIAEWLGRIRAKQTPQVASEPSQEEPKP